MSNDSSVTSADILALISIAVALAMGAIAFHLWAENDRLTQAINELKESRVKVTQTIECR